MKPDMTRGQQAGMIGQEMQAEGQGQESGGLTITSDLMKKQIYEKLKDPKYKKMVDFSKYDLDRIVYAGLKVMFSQETHQLMLDEINRTDIPIEDRLGNGIASLMFILFDQSKNKMPQGAIIPAGSILLAKAAEFVDQTGLAEVTDDTYADAAETMTTVIMGKFDPIYAEKIGKAKAGLPLEAQLPTEAPEAGLIAQAQGR